MCLEVQETEFDTNVHVGWNVTPAAMLCQDFVAFQMCSCDLEPLMQLFSFTEADHRAQTPRLEHANIL